MTLHIYDTGARALREFVPAREDRTSIYVCGPTPQGAPHIGHVRGALNYDVLRRWLARDGADVLLVRNVTDIDDKILNRAAEAGRPWWEWAATHERAFEESYAALGCLPASLAPRATGHITQMVELMQRLIDAGCAYPSGGDVYFSVEAFPEYGALSGQRLEEMQQGESAAAGKSDPRDFTLWKASKPGEPAWPTPWGPGRPGWHLECSAMATVYLGETFDIHGGGVDLIFPHHENELAQSRAAGDGFARYWMHNAWVTLSGEKMSKSLGNVVSIPAMLERTRPQELRYYLISAHYRSTIEYSPEALEDAVSGYRRLESFLRRAAGRIGSVARGELPGEFIVAMDDDLGTPKAIGVAHSVTREGNAALESGDEAGARTAAGSVRAMLDVLGLDPFDEQWAERGAEQAAHSALGTLVEGLLERRTKARSERDFATADLVRDQLTDAGIAVEDTPDGPQWTFKD